MSNDPEKENREDEGNGNYSGEPVNSLMMRDD